MNFDIFDIVNIVLAAVLVYAMIRPTIVKSGLTERNRHISQAVNIADSLAKGIITNYTTVTSLTGSQKKKQAAEDLMNRIKSEPGVDISRQTAIERIQVAYDKQKEEEKRKNFKK